MDAATLRLFFVVTDLIAPLAVGYALKKRHLITQRTNDRLIRFNIIIVNTILALLSFWVLPLTWSLLLLPLFGFYLVLFPGGVGYLLFARRLANYLDRGAYVASAMLANLGTLGGVCAFPRRNELPRHDRRVPRRDFSGVVLFDEMKNALARTTFVRAQFFT